MSPPTWETTGDWDSAQSEKGVHHNQPANTDWAPSDQHEKGYPTTDEGGTALELYYPLDEDSGTTVNDVSGNGRHGTNNGATVGTAAILGTTGYTFDGSTSYIQTTWSGITGSTNRACVTWVKIPSSPTTDDGNLFHWGTNPGGASGARWTVRTDLLSGTGNVLRAEVDGGFIKGTTALNDGAWHHVAAVLNGTDITDVSLYVDGTSETIDSSSAQSISTDGTANDVRLGASNVGSSEYFLDSVMDEPQVYSRALSGSEVSDHYQAAL